MPSHPTHKQTVRCCTLRPSCTTFCILFAIILSIMAVPASAADAPQITGIFPLGGPVTGGTPVTITGSGFSGATNVRFGELPGSSLAIYSNERITVIAPAHPAGAVAITVTTAAGNGSTFGPPLVFNYEEYPFPRPSEISPSSGPCDRSVVITLTGSGFTNTDKIWFGNESGYIEKITDDSHMEVRPPQSSPGTVDIRLRNAHGTTPPQDPPVTYTFDYPFPKLTGITPSSGSALGGTVVTVTGSGLSGTTGVRFGNTFGSNLSIINNYQLTVVSPPNPAGTVAVYVINPAFTGGSRDAATVFRYDTPLPRLTGVSPSSGSMDGGTVVTLTGSGFTGTRNVSFGGKPATSLNVIDDNRLTVLSPPSRLGSFPITIRNDYGEGGTLGPSTAFRYEIPPITLTTVPTRAEGTANNTDNDSSSRAIPIIVTTPSPLPTTKASGPEILAEVLLMVVAIAIIGAAGFWKRG